MCVVSDAVDSKQDLSLNCAVHVHVYPDTVPSVLCTYMMSGSNKLCGVRGHRGHYLLLGWDRLCHEGLGYRSRFTDMRGMEYCGVLCMARGSSYTTWAGRRSESKAR